PALSWLTYLELAMSDGSYPDRGGLSCALSGEIPSSGAVDTALLQQVIHNFLVIQSSILFFRPFSEKLPTCASFGDFSS
ncbi:hypothetical protein, partial [Pseudomonas veronii]